MLLNSFISLRLIVVSERLGYSFMLQIECTIPGHDGIIHHDKQVICLFAGSYTDGEVLHSSTVQSSRSYAL